MLRLLFLSLFGKHSVCALKSSTETSLFSRFSPLLPLSSLLLLIKLHKWIFQVNVCVREEFTLHFCALFSILCYCCWRKGSRMFRIATQIFILPSFTPPTTPQCIYDENFKVASQADLLLLSHRFVYVVHHPLLSFYHCFLGMRLYLPLTKRIYFYFCELSFSLAKID